MCHFKFFASKTLENKGFSRLKKLGTVPSNKLEFSTVCDIHILETFTKGGEMKDRETITFHIPLSRHHICLLRELSEETGKPIHKILEEAIDEYLEEIKKECEGLPGFPGRK